MSLNPAAVKQHFSSKKPVITGSAGDAGGGDTVIFSEQIFLKEKLQADLLWIHGLTGEQDFDYAIAIVWHKITLKDKASIERLARIVSLARLSSDGKSRPPFDFREEYKKIVGTESAPTMGMKPR